MSTPRPDLPNSKQDALTYVNWLVSLNVFDKIILQGSRSPLREKVPDETSDWDFALVSEIHNLIIVHPRDSGQLHADINMVNENRLHQIARRHVEVWPNDTHGVFKDE